MAWEGVYCNWPQAAANVEIAHFEFKYLTRCADTSYATSIVEKTIMNVIHNLIIVRSTGKIKGIQCGFCPGKPNLITVDCTLHDLSR
jgi:hypothetical protein